MLPFSGLDWIPKAKDGVFLERNYFVPDMCVCARFIFPLWSAALAIAK